MAWIESHQELRDHPKTRRLARMLGISVPQAVGHLHCLWWWALDYAEDGDLSPYDAADIADAAMWDGDPESFVDALIRCGPGGRCGFIERTEDDRLTLHDWYEYAGRLIEQRRKERDRKRDMRQAYDDGVIDAVRARDGDRCRYCGKAVNWKDRRGPDGGTYDHVHPDRPATVDNIVVCCRACNSRKGHRTPEQAGLRLLPIGAANSGSGTDLDPTQNGPGTDLGRNLPTVPNRTEPNQNQERERGEGRPASPAGDPPALTPERVAAIWNDVCGDVLPRVTKLTDTRRRHVKARLAADRSRDEAWWRSYFARIRASPFCCGDNPRGWRADFDFAVRSEDVVARVLEGRYESRKPAKDHGVSDWTGQRSGVVDMRAILRQRGGAL